MQHFCNDQSKMLHITFSGKILESQTVGYTIFASEVTTAVTSNYTKAWITLDKFGISKVMNAGVHCDTLVQETSKSGQIMEAALSRQDNTCNIPVSVSPGTSSMLMVEILPHLKLFLSDVGLKMMHVIH